MKKAAKFLLAISLLALLNHQPAIGQCAVCTKTAQQLGEKPALGMNQGILYLMGMPFILVGFIGYKWWRNNKGNF